MTGPLIGTVALIWAQASNRVIGDRGRLPWDLPEDLARFKALTMGLTVVMGRSTWESLPASVRPLPGRANVVLSRDPAYDAAGAQVVSGMETALQSATTDVWVIGGAQVYVGALPFATRAEVTELARAFPGDVHAPELDETWQVASCEPADGWLQSRSGLDYRLVSYLRGDR